MLSVEFFERWGLVIALGTVGAFCAVYKASAAAELNAASEAAKAERERAETEDRAWWKRRAEQVQACRERGGEPINQMGPDIFCVKKECEFR